MADYRQYFQAVLRAIVLIHPPELRREQRRFLPARARAQFEIAAPLVVFVLGQKQNPKFLLQSRQPLAAGLRLLGKQRFHLPVRLLFRLFEIGPHLPFAGEVFEVFFRRIL